MRTASMSRPRVGLVEHGERRLENRHLQDLRALLLAAREADVHGALQHLHVDRELGGLVADELHEFRRRQLGFAALLAERVGGRAQESQPRDARDFHGVLEGEEHAFRGALVGVHLEEALAVPEDVALGDLVAGAPGEHVGERRFARPVRPHDRVHLSFREREREPFQDLTVLVGELHVQVLDLKHLSHSSSHSHTVPPASPISRRFLPSSRR